MCKKKDLGGYPYPRFKYMVTIGIFIKINTNNTTKKGIGGGGIPPNVAYFILSMDKLNFFEKCHHSEEEDQGCPFAIKKGKKTLCNQILGYNPVAVDIRDLKSCFMNASPRDKNSMINKTKKTLPL